jgi:hypothetical protein
MKREQKGICSTGCCPMELSCEAPQHNNDSHNDAIIIEIANPNDDSESSFLDANPTQAANMIENEDKYDNVFAFAAFADKHTEILYSDLTGTFPFMSLEGNVCFRVVYHYQSNTILALPIANFTNECILAAYQQ